MRASTKFVDRVRGLTLRRVRWYGGLGCGARMAARSSKDQWRAFLRNLIRQSNPGRDCKLTQRQAFAKLSEEFGADVSASDRQWVKDTMCDIQQGIYDGKIAAQKVLSKNKRQVLLSSSDDDDDVPIELQRLPSYLPCSAPRASDTGTSSILVYYSERCSCN